MQRHFANSASTRSNRIGVGSTSKQSADKLRRRVNQEERSEDPNEKAQLD
jgi:hypothetical protein